MGIIDQPKWNRSLENPYFHAVRRALSAAWLGAFFATACSISEHEFHRPDAGDAGDGRNNDGAGRDGGHAGDDVSGSDRNPARDASDESDTADRRDASTNGEAGGMDASDAIADSRNSDSSGDATSESDGSDVTGDIAVVDRSTDDREAGADRVLDVVADVTPDVSLDAVQDVVIDRNADVVGADQDAPIVVGTDIWAVGRAGTVLHWAQSTGWVFDAIPPTTASFFDIWGTDRTNVWAVGDGDILHYDGTSWTSVANPVPQSRLSAIWGSSRTDVWAVGYHVAQARGLILRYNGTSWSDQAGGPTVFDQRTFTSVWGSGPRDVWVVGGDKVFHFGANANWDEVALPDAGANWLEAVWTSSATQGWMMGAEGQIMQLAAGVWSPSPPYPDAPRFKAVSGLSPNDAWAIAWATPLQVENRFYRNTGSGWQDGPSVMLPLMYDIFMRSSQDVWFAGFNGVIAHYDGMAITADPTVPTQEILHGIWGPR